jgi:bifunctional DNA-binding transcriptional regulator/antitoxin component of YhaV-PrlF toxin-antitoxin module
MAETFVAQVSRGRITIDQKIRDLLGITDGDYVRVSVEKANTKEA